MGFLDIVGGLANVGSTIAGTVSNIKTNKETLLYRKRILPIRRICRILFLLERIMQYREGLPI